MKSISNKFVVLHFISIHGVTDALHLIAILGVSESGCLSCSLTLYKVFLTTEFV